MNLKDDIIKSFERGEEQAKEKGTIKVQWLDYYKFKTDPFVEEIEDSKVIEELFVDRKGVLTKLAEYIGGSKFVQEFYIIGIVGPKGSGKSTILNILSEFSKIKYELLFYNVYLDSTLGDREYSSHRKDYPFEDPIYRCIFYDECYPTSKLKSYIESAKRHPCVIICALSPKQADTLKLDQRIPLKRMNKSDIKQFLQLRIDRVGNAKVFMEEFYNDIAEISLGNPLLALKNAKKVAIEIFNKQEKNESMVEILNKFVKRFKKQTADIKEVWSSLTTKEETVLDIILEKSPLASITPKELEKNIDGGRTLAWKYLERLREKNLLEKEYQGRSSIYRIKLNIRIILETLYMDDSF